ncbi:MAG: tellurite resistance TerB family protein [Elioraea sp.]|nr:tellurite resistance TerB family protein [Elioraea sp.]
MDTNRLLGALLGGVLAAPRRRATRRRTPAPLIDVRIGGSRRTAAALAALAGLAVEALAKAGQPVPTQPAPLPRPAPPPATGRPTSAPRPSPAAPNPWASAPAAPPPPAEPVGAEDREALLTIRAMIAAARADGTLDAAEREAIAGQLDQADLEPEARDLVLREFAQPASVEAIAREVTDPVLAAQIYAACILAVGEASAAERAWLDRFAALTGLSAATRRAIEERLAGG